MISYRAILDVSRELARYVAGLLRAETPPAGYADWHTEVELFLAGRGGPALVS